jgi:hypothetical protein
MFYDLADRGTSSGHNPDFGHDRLWQSILARNGNCRWLGPATKVQNPQGVDAGAPMLRDDAAHRW